MSRRERADQTRARMIEAAYRLFMRDGYDATTMQAVAEEHACELPDDVIGFALGLGMLELEPPRESEPVDPFDVPSQPGEVGA